MTNFKLTFVTGLGLLLGTPLMAGHCDVGPQIQRAAHELEEEAKHFAELLADNSEYAHVTDDAQKLALEAEHLHEAVEEAPSCEHVRADFRKVETAFFHLRREYRRSHDIHHDRHIEEDFDSVVRAYRQTERAVFSGGPGPGPGPGPITTYQEVSLGSSRYGLNQLALSGRIVGIRLLAQQSSARCIAGVSYGSSGNVLWVNRGCRGTFGVNLERGHH